MILISLISGSLLILTDTLIPTDAGDDCEKDIDPANVNQYIVWATGGLGETAFIHSERSGGEDWLTS